MSFVVYFCKVAGDSLDALDVVMSCLSMAKHVSNHDNKKDTSDRDQTYGISTTTIKQSQQSFCHLA